MRRAIPAAVLLLVLSLVSSAPTPAPATAPRAALLAGLPYCGSASHLCINGWVWECRCFSYGCQYVTTAWRCERKR